MTKSSRPARDAAHKHGMWVHLGSLAVLTEGGQLANRAFVIDPRGEVRARYDKIHLFDVDLPTGESWRESTVYQHGSEAVVVDGTPVGQARALRSATTCASRRCSPGWPRRVRTSSPFRPPSPFRPARRIGKCCFARARSRRGCSSWLRPSRGIMRTAATPTAIRWSSTPGARCCSTWARSRSGLCRHRSQPDHRRAQPRARAQPSPADRRGGGAVIVFDLRCGDGCAVFEGWFDSGADFDAAVRARAWSNAPIAARRRSRRRRWLRASAARTAVRQRSRRRSPNWPRCSEDAQQFANGSEPTCPRRRGRCTWARWSRARSTARRAPSEARSLIDEGVPVLPLPLPVVPPEPSELIKPRRMPYSWRGRLRSSAG